MPLALQRRRRGTRQPNEQELEAGGSERQVAISSKCKFERNELPVQANDRVVSATQEKYNSVSSFVRSFGLCASKVRTG